VKGPRRGLALTTALVIIAVTAIGASLIAYYLSLNKQISSTRWTVIDKDYESFSNVYDYTLELQFGSASSKVMWDKKAVAALGLVGREFSIEDVGIYYISVSWEKATKGTYPSIMGKCYRALIEDNYTSPKSVTDRKESKLNFTKEEWDKLDYSIKSRIVKVGSVVSHGNTVIAKVPLTRYLVYNDAIATFQEGYNPLFSSGCSGWTTVRETVLRVINYVTMIG